MIDRAIQYFDLFSKIRPTGVRPQASGPNASGLTWHRQMALWAGLTVGVIIQPMFPNFNSEEAVRILDSIWSIRSVLAAIIALLIFPSVYRNAFNPNEPLLAQAGTVVMAGIGWRSVFDAG